MDFTSSLIGHMQIIEGVPGREHQRFAVDQCSHNTDIILIMLQQRPIRDCHNNNMNIKPH